jgi:hypothetical protein
MPSVRSRHDHDRSDGAPTDPPPDTSGSANLRVRPAAAPEPSSPNEPGGIFTANLKGRELTNRCRADRAELIATAQVGSIRGRRHLDLLGSFLARTDRTLCIINR